MIKVIAVDLGGVYFSHGSRVAAERLEKEYGYDANIIRDLLRSPHSHDLRKGLLEDEKFWNLAQTQLPKNYDTNLIKRVWYDSYILDEDIEELVKKLRQRGYTIMAFSGNIRTRVEYLEKKYNFRKNFDEEIYSFDYNLIKPEKKFVRVLIDKSQCRPEEILYIDDKSDNATPAVDLGINVVIYSRGQIDKLLKELKKYEIII